ncbi:MAG: glycosyltransferase family 4 protein [Paludisphaera borealis]|uniref:glycosyltransferase family 4 protein n=1 Tax=Paludisphaera borealis TaxID=1387353 RepID=UPI00283B2013|nr:glycosyltransferase family 4 protein [Paludisphaera borealis]MDR3618167.1 glycosyltransferase family 4 protein [Paludisphaera borealis]
MRIFYAAGPGNVIGTYRHYLRGEQDPSQISMTYSGQFFDVCRKLDLDATVVTVFREEGSFAAERVEIENWPRSWLNSGGIRYRLGNLWYHLRLNLAVLRSRAKAMVLSDDGAWYLLFPVAFLGVKIIPSIHCTLWASDRPPGFRHRMVLKFNGWFFRRCTVGVMCVSDEIARQVRSIAGDALPIGVFLPSYLPGTFENSESRQAPREGERRRILFVGRIEVDKGAFDLIEIARQLREQGRNDLLFEVCGDGGALEDMKAKCELVGLADDFRFHGYVKQPELGSIFRSAFALIVPTRREFAEGFNKVVAEGVLARKPVITSSVCPAVEYFGDGVVVVPPEDASAYAAAIARLADDPAFYEATVNAGDEHRAQLYDEERSWARTLEKLLAIASPAFRARERAESSV